MIDPELIQVRKDENLDKASLTKYLSKLFCIEIKEFDLMQFGGGHANLTYLIKFNGCEYVLRKPPIGPLVFIHVFRGSFVFGKHCELKLPD